MSMFLIHDTRDSILFTRRRLFENVVDIVNAHWVIQSEKRTNKAKYTLNFFRYFMSKISFFIRSIR